MKQLLNKVIFLTGGSAGIGLECAKKYLENGAIVVIVANTPESLRFAAEVLNSENVHFMLCDVAYAAEVEQAINKTIAQFGQIDVIHNNAGFAQPSSPIHTTSDEEWYRLFDVNVKSIMLTARYGIEALIKTAGCIINTSSLVGEIGQDNHAAYAATKGAVNALTKSMALDYAPFKVRINAVAPAGVWTDMLRKWSSEQPDPGSMERYLNNIHALGYCPEGDVVADACVFLASDNAKFITGHIMPVSGGAELGYRVVTMQEQVVLSVK
jgi:meso-butanediol dehydrogenase/(S,S)-butanediol dehydrogenase/diacetyl reductase